MNFMKIEINFANMIRLIILIAFTFFIKNTYGQNALVNPSFEEQPGKSSVPTGWVTCIPGSTPDILPGKWGVNKAPQNGMAYLGLITRENGTFESIGQKLKKPLDANSCYNFSVYLSRSDSYTGYNLPLRLKIWGSKKFCAKEQLLVSTKAIKHTDWARYDFQIYTKSKIHFLTLEACSAPGITIPYKGNILIDNISDIKPCFKAEFNGNHRDYGRASVMSLSMIQVPYSTQLLLGHFLQHFLQILVLSAVFRPFVFY